MNDEDFVMGYAVGYNDGVGSGGGSGGGLIIPEGNTPIYNVPILHNYIFEGTEFGLGTIDINSCAFLNNFARGCYWSYAKNIITGEVYMLPDGNPNVSRKIAVAITKNGVAIGLIQLSSYDVATSENTYYRLIDGSWKKAHGNISVSKIEYPEITIAVSEEETRNQMYIYFEYDIVTEDEEYNNNSSKYGTYIDASGKTQYYRYYDEADIDVYQGTSVTVLHRKEQITIFTMTKIKPSADYPESLLNVYQMDVFAPSVIWGTDIENIREFHLSLTTGLSG